MFRIGFANCGLRVQARVVLESFLVFLCVVSLCITVLFFSVSGYYVFVFVSLLLMRYLTIAFLIA